MNFYNLADSTPARAKDNKYKKQIFYKKNFYQISAINF